MFCPKCGYKVEKGVKFCPKCGQNLMVKKSSSESKSTESKATESTSLIKKYRHNKKVIATLVAIVVVLFGYMAIYAPMTIKSVLQREEFTAKNGYEVSVNPLTRTIRINAGEAGMNNIERGLNSTHFDTSAIALEYHMASAAKSISKKTIGSWKINLTQTRYKDTDTLMWQFTGNNETHRYQNTAACRKNHQDYLQAEADSAEQDQKNSDAAGIAGGLLGGALGYMF